MLLRKADMTAGKRVLILSTSWLFWHYEWHWNRSSAKNRWRVQAEPNNCVQRNDDPRSVDCRDMVFQCSV